MFRSQVIGIAVEITAQHGGWFEFRICPNNDVHTPATHECLNQHVLSRADGSGNRVFMRIGGPQGFHNTTLRLPSGLTCTQCVLQWKWHTGRLLTDLTQCSSYFIIIFFYLSGFSHPRNGIENNCSTLSCPVRFPPLTPHFHIYLTQLFPPGVLSFPIIHQNNNGISHVSSL